MKKLILVIVIVLAVAAGVMSVDPVNPGKSFPVIKEYGGVYDVPFAEEMPDPALQYKIIADVGEKNEKAAELYSPLEYIARMYNLHVYAGVPQKNLDVAVALHSEAIYLILTNEAYHKKFGVDNPNIKVLGELKKAGVKIFGCGQAIQRNAIAKEDINPDVTVALSRFTVVSEYQMKGYAFFKY
jgi:intracellular sulfur oxidation DsrE/DsrF family protein